MLLKLNRRSAPLLLCVDINSLDTHAKLRNNGYKVRCVTFDEQTDARDLLGQWSCQSGAKMAWKPGILPEAMREGSVLLVEAILTSSGDVLSKLTEVGFSRKISKFDSPSTEFVEAHSDFQIFAIHYYKSGEDPLLALTRSEFWKPLLSSWERIVMPTSISYLPITKFESWFLEKFFPTFLNQLEQLAELSTLLVYRRLPNWNDAYKTLQLIQSKRDDELPALRVWPDIMNVPNQQRVGIATLMAARLLSSLPAAARRPASEIIGKWCQLDPSWQNQVVVLINPEIYRPGHISLKDLGLIETKVQSSVFQRMVLGAESGESILLVGNTGTGKTALCQALSKFYDLELRIVNLHDQIEVSDLIGEIVPTQVVSSKSDVIIIKRLFEKVLSRGRRTKWLMKKSLIDRMERCLREGDPWLMKTMLTKVIQKVIKLLESNISKIESGHLALKTWIRLANSLELAKPGRLMKSEFRQGALLEAVEKGYMILLDEINLAPPDVISRLIPLIGQQEFIVHEDGGRLVKVHPKFRLLGSMNPSATISDEGKIVGISSGKKELPEALRLRFFEVYVDEVMNEIDIQEMIASSPRLVKHAVPLQRLYSSLIAQASSGSLEASHNSAPCINLRALNRFIRFVSERGRRANSKVMVDIVDGIHASFMSNLIESSRQLVWTEVEKILGYKRQVKATMVLPDPTQANFFKLLRPEIEAIDGGVVLIDGYGVLAGSETALSTEYYCQRFLATPSVRQLIQSLCVILSGSTSPILLEGPTSSGKTSIVEFLSGITQHKFVRINNHEQITLSEYLGQYVSDDTGGFSFQPG